MTLLMTWTTAVVAGPYDAPATYYNSATGTGSALKSQLHNIIDNHTTFSYSAARTILQVTDVDPTNSSKMILVYDRNSINGSNLSSWNREHTWPQSRGLDSTGAPDGSDLHQLRPSTIQVNSDRGNLNFGGVYGAQSYGQVTDKGQAVWYPGDADAGMIAREQFYMAVRYDGSDSGTKDLELVNGNPGIHGTTLGDLARLIEWHYAAVPDNFELRRNDVIFDDYQHNRNPFIDRPEFVWSVFVDQANDSRITIGGASVDGNGGSVAGVSLGRVLVGSPIPSNQSVTLNKSGDDGTYYRVNTAGSATSTAGGPYNAFRTGGADSTTLGVGLSPATSTASAGQRSGSVTIDNLDVTTGGGTGRGANDADDTVNVTLDVLDHANPSFTGGSDLNTLTIDFGAITLGGAAPTFQFDLFNLENTTNFTAGLDFDSLIGSGDTSALTTDLQTFGGATPLAAGLNNTFTASLDTSTVGSYSALYTLSFSDEDLPGASNGLGDLQLMLTGTIEEASIASADFDQDTDIDGEDFLTWQRGLLAGTTLAAGDANGDTIVDGLDLDVWQQQFGSHTPAAGLVTIPEPTTLYVCGLGLMFWLGGAGRRHTCYRNP